MDRDVGQSIQFFLGKEATRRSGVPVDEPQRLATLGWMQDINHGLKPLEWSLRRCQDRQQDVLESDRAPILILCTDQESTRLICASCAADLRFICASCSLGLLLVYIGLPTLPRMCISIALDLCLVGFSYAFSKRTCSAPFRVLTQQLHLDYGGPCIYCSPLGNAMVRTGLLVVLRCKAMVLQLLAPG